MVLAAAAAATICRVRREPAEPRRSRSAWSSQSGIPNLIGYLAGVGGETGGLHTALTRRDGRRRRSRARCGPGARRDWITAVGLATLLVLLTLSWMLPSYLLWLLPFAALAPGRWLRIAAIVFAVYVFIFWMPYTDALERCLHLHLGTTGLAQRCEQLPELARVLSGRRVGSRRPAARRERPAAMPAP